MKRAKGFFERVLPYASTAAGQRHLLALRDAMIHIVPFTLVNSAFVLVSYFPWSVYQEFMTRILGQGWQSWEAAFIRPAMTGILALVGAVTAASSLAKSYGHDGTEAGVLALTAFALLAFRGGGRRVSMDGRWLWLAMLSGLSAAEIQHRISEERIQGSVRTKIPPAFARSVRPMLPLFVVVVVFGGLRFFMGLISGEIFGDFWMHWIQRPVFHLGTSLPGTMLAQAVNSLFWGMGLHGAQLVNSVMLPAWTIQMLENLEVFTSGGRVLPNIVTKQFIELFIWTGGSAGTMSMVIWIKLFAKSEHVRMVGKTAFIPAVFNIDEPIIFGLPVALNPILMVPLLLAPLMTTAFSYLTMRAGIFPMTCGIDLPWTTPVLIGGFLATGGNVMGAVLQLCNMGISFLVYAPFIYVYDGRMAETEKRNRDK